MLFLSLFFSLLIMVLECSSSLYLENADVLLFCKGITVRGRITSIEDMSSGSPSIPKPDPGYSKIFVRIEGQRPALLRQIPNERGLQGR